MSRRRPGAEEEAHYVGNWQRPLDPGEPLRAKIEAAAAVNLLRPDSDLPGCTIENTRIVAPDARTAGVAREALAAAHIEAEVVEAGDDRSRNQPRKPRKAPEPAEAPDADDARAPAKPAKRSAPSKAATRSAATRNRSAATWAEANPEEAGKLLEQNLVIVLDLLPDGKHDELRELLSSGDSSSERPAAAPITREELTLDAMFLRPYQEIEKWAKWQEKRATRTSHMVSLARRLHSTVKVGNPAKPLTVLAAAREALSADRRNPATLPATPRLQVTEAPEGRERLPNLLTEDVELETAQITLPAMAAAIGCTDPIGPAPWVALFDRLGGLSIEQKRGAPAALRLFVESLALAPPTACRGARVNVPGVTLRDLRDALYPHGWNRGKQLPLLLRAMDEVNALAWVGDGRRRWRLVLFGDGPDLGAKLDDEVELLIRIPPVLDAGVGARFDRPTLRRLGLLSAAAYRLYLGLVSEWDRVGRRGRPPSSWRGIGPAERRRLIYGPDATIANTNRQRQKRADAAFDALDDEGVIHLQRDPDDPRIWRPERRDLTGG